MTADEFTENYRMTHPAAYISEIPAIRTSHRRRGRITVETGNYLGSAALHISLTLENGGEVTAAITDLDDIALLIDVAASLFDWIDKGPPPRNDFTPPAGNDFTPPADRIAAAEKRGKRRGPGGIDFGMA